MQRPVFLVVADDGSRREALSLDLSRRYTGDYRVVGAASARTALTMLADLASSGTDVALLVADEHLADMPALDFLVRAHDLHPGAKRVLLIERGNWSATHPALSWRWRWERSTPTCTSRGSRWNASCIWQ